MSNADNSLTISRRGFLLASSAAAASGLTWNPAAAQSSHELKLASFVPPSHSIWVDPLTPWTKDVASRSGGKLTVRMFPSMQLGGKPPELYRQMVQGIADIVFTLPGYTSSDFPMMTMTELPGAASSAEDGTRKFWEHARFFEKELADAKVLMLWNSDSAGIMSRDRPVQTLADMKGMRIRTPSAVQSAQLEILGAIPVSMPATQIYNSLERGVIDAVMIGMSTMIDFKLLEVVRHITVNAPLGRSPFMVAMSRKRYEGLPDDLRKIIDDTTGVDLSLRGAVSYDKKGIEAVALARKQRNVIELTDDEIARWIEAFQPLVKRAVAENDKRGLPASEFASVYGLTK